MRAPVVRSERGIALIVVLLLTVALAAVAVGSAMLLLNGGLMRRHSERARVADDAALAGLEEARSRLNGTATLYPDSDYVTLQNGTAVLDAAGGAVPGLRRWLYAGPSGVSTGQYGVFGSILAVVEDANQTRVVRRLEVSQESFAKFAYFTDVEPSNIAFGATDQIFGPIHTNDVLKIYPPSGGNRAKFWDEVRTAKTVSVPGNGTFVKGYTENAAVIPMPTVQQLARLQAQAAAGSMSFAGTTAGGQGQADLRVEFVAVDLNDDGDATDEDEGFIRVYRGVDPAFVVASVPAAGPGASRNCGDSQGDHPNVFRSTADHPASGAAHNKAASLNDASSICLLGGDPTLTNGWTPATADGAWIPWGGPVAARVAARRPDAAYLHPITRALNPDFKGVIYVSGKVAVSGTVRGRVTLVSPNAIIIADDVRQATDPGAGICDDILGLFSAGEVIVADNSINAPVLTTGGGNNYKTMDPDGDVNEWIHAVVLALDVFAVERYDQGPTNSERCGTTNWGRGCLYLTGGIIQRTRGAVGTTAGHGNLKRYSYNACAYSDPPPYFPTTGHFDRNRTYELDPIGFDVAAWFDQYQR